MTAKSVVEVEVNSSQFSEFYKIFQEYQSHLSSMPEDWKAAGEAISDAGGEMEGFSEASNASKDFLLIAATQAEVISKEIRAASASNNALIESLKTGTKAQKGFADETERGNKAMVSMKKNADDVAKSIFGIGKFLLKFGAIGGGIAGLGGILGTLSLRDLAESAVDTQRNARRLGMTPGQLTAFHQDLGNYVDPSILNNVANAQGSFKGRVGLSRALGVGMDQLADMDPGQLSGQLALKAHDWWVNMPAALRTSDVFQSTGLAQSGAVSFEMARQDGHTPRADISQGLSQYGPDQVRFNVPDQNSKAWYDFLRQIKDTGNTIETDLKNKLVALSPDLQKFADVMGKDAMKLIDDIFTPKNLNALEDGIDSLTNYLGSKKFGQDIKTFTDAVSEIASDAKGLADIITKILHPFGGSNETPEARQKRAELAADAATQGLSTPAFGGGDATAADARNAKFVGTVDSVARKAASAIYAGGKAYLSGDFSGDTFGKIRHDLNMPQNPKAILAQLNQKYGLPAGTLEGMWQIESSEGKKLIGPPTKTGERAIGDFQFMSGAWKDWGKGGDRYNFMDEANAAGRFMASNQKRYGGDVRKSLAAYNDGRGNINPNDANWESKLPRETRNYESQIRAQIAKLASAIDHLRRSPKGIQVTNSTSARVAVQANAAAIQ